MKDTPAFPMSSGDEPRVDRTTHYNEGMTLHQWFAAMASETDVLEVLTDERAFGRNTSWVQCRLIHADKMIAAYEEREKA